MAYFNGFVDKEDVLREFNASEEWVDIEVLYAWYNQECYEGSAFVLFRKDEKLYEVNGSHCSCYGLEEQFQPEETSVEALTYRLVNGNYWYGPPEDELKEVLKNI